MNIKFETFKNIYEFQNALETREVNPLFKGSQSSHYDRPYFTNVKNFEEADNYLKNGWNTQVENMTAELRKFSQKIEVTRTKQFKNVAGFAPCVPNAIRGVPKSMIASKTIRVPENRRTLHLVLNNCGVSKVTTEELMKCGMTVLKLANLLDKSRIRTQIDVVPKLSKVDDEFIGCAVTIKEYKQPFNLSKMAYPLAHVAMFRCHGFNYLEVQDGKLNSDWTEQGTSLSRCTSSEKNAVLKKLGFTKENGIFYIDINDCKNADYDPEKLAKAMEINL